MTNEEAIERLKDGAPFNELLDVKWEEAVNMAIEALKDRPTGWIPVSERLPEEDDYKSCTECLDGAVWYFTENGTMGLGYYYKSVKEWSTIDDLKTDEKVVAWMPLPSPYKAESEDKE